MAATRTVHDPFIGKAVQISDRLSDRLRGRYACGPTMANGEPELGWRQMPQIPIQLEAADRLDKVEALLRDIDDQLINTPDKCFIIGEPATPDALAALACIAIRLRSILS